MQPAEVCLVKLGYTVVLKSRRPPSQFMHLLSWSSGGVSAAVEAESV